MSEDEGSIPSRRQLLKGLGIGGAAALLAGCGERPSPPVTETPQPTERPPERTPEWPPPERADYGTVVDVVEAGADAGGGSPINPILDEHAGDDTLLLFPQGEYLLDDFWELREFEHFGIVGNGAVVRPPDGYSGYLLGFGINDRAVDFHFEGITFDITAPDTGVRPLHASIEDGLYVKDVTVRGLHDTDQDSFRFDVTSPDGSGLVENLRMPDGGVPQYLITACYVGDISVGKLTFRDCHIAGYPDNGIYASQAKGPVHVIGGLFENNNVSNVRVSSDAVVRGVTVRSNERIAGFNNVRGIRLRSGRNILVEDCDVEFSEVQRSGGAIVMHDDLQTATIRNTRVRVDTDDVPAIMAKNPAHPIPEGEPGLRFENVEISGSAANRSAIVLDERGSNELSGICIHQSGDSRNGIRLIRSQNNRIRDSWIHVTGEPLVLQDAKTSRENVMLGKATPDDGNASCSELRLSRSGNVVTQNEE